MKLRFPSKLRDFVFFELQITLLWFRAMLSIQFQIFRHWNHNQFRRNIYTHTKVFDFWLTFSQFFH